MVNQFNKLGHYATGRFSDVLLQAVCSIFYSASGGRGEGGLAECCFIGSVVL